MYVSKCARENMKEREKGIVAYILHLPSERKSKGSCVLLTCRKKYIYLQPCKNSSYFIMKLYHSFHHVCLFMSFTLPRDDTK